jgi:hypothetical protein
MNESGTLPAISLRLLRLHDRWQYRATGTLTPPGTEPRDLTGEITVSIAEDRLLGRADCMSIVFSQRFEVTVTDGSKQLLPAPEWMFSFVQDTASRDLSIVADNMTRTGSPRAAREPQVFYPGTWSLQTAYNNRLEFDNGDVVENTLGVFKQEQVETEAGSYRSWVARISSNSAATGLIEGTDWWTPELGAPARFATVSTTPDGSQMRFVATLVSSSIR